MQFIIQKSIRLVPDWYRIGIGLVPDRYHNFKAFFLPIPINDSSGQSSPSNLSSKSSQAELRHPPGLELGKQYCEDPPSLTVCRQSSCPRTDKYAGGSPPIRNGHYRYS